MLPVPEFQLYQRQRRQRSDLARLRVAIAAAMPLCVAESKANGVLASLPLVEASIVSDPAIAKVHAEFLADPTPTDVITFHHGELLVSADTAAREGPAHGHSTDEELCLYLIHGLIHLAGWDDHDPAEAAEMKQRQERILAAAWPSA